MAEENEFEKMYNKDEFAENESSNKTNSEKPVDEMASNESSSLEYDVTKAPKATKGPDREDLDGKKMVITDMKLFLPSPEKAWDLSRDKKTKYKPCQFVLYYGTEGQREYYSGVKVFERIENGVSKYSDPNIQNNAKTQAALLKQNYAAFKNKKVEEVSLHEFFSYLKSKPEVMIKKTLVSYDNEKGETINADKNFVGNFL